MRVLLFTSSRTDGCFFSMAFPSSRGTYFHIRLSVFDQLNYRDSSVFSVCLNVLEKRKPTLSLDYRVRPGKEKIPVLRMASKTFCFLEL